MACYHLFFLSHLTILPLRSPYYEDGACQGNVRRSPHPRFATCETRLVKLGNQFFWYNSYKRKYLEKLLNILIKFRFVSNSIHSLFWSILLYFVYFLWNHCKITVLYLNKKIQNEKLLLFFFIKADELQPASHYWRGVASLFL